jgi:alkylation response protein AidB-like acyl-CoA dehydrogenase
VFTEEEEMIRETSHRFAMGEIAPKVREMEKNGSMDKSLIQSLFDAGLMSIEVEEEYGGGAMNFTSSLIVIEELSKVDPSVAVMVDIHNTLTLSIIRSFGNEEQKQRWIPSMCSDTLSAFALSETESGSDAFAMRTRAELSEDGSHYVLSGAKAWISNSEHANLFFVFANADPSKGHRGITCFVVERGMEGFEIGLPEEKLGLKASSTCPLTFDGVRVPVENRIGQEGDGYKIAIGILNEGRIGIGASCLGIAQGCLDATLPYLMERKQFNTRILDFQSMEHQVAQAAVELEAARVLTFNAARMKEAGLPFIREASMSKLYASQVANNICSRCIDWLGGVGFTTANLAEKFYRDVKVSTIYEGSSNIQLSTIAKLLKKDLERNM